MQQKVTSDDEKRAFFSAFGCHFASQNRMNIFVCTPTTRRSPGDQGVNANFASTPRGDRPAPDVVPRLVIPDGTWPAASTAGFFSAALFADKKSLNRFPNVLYPLKGHKR